MILPDDTVKGIAATAFVELSGKTHEIPVKENQTVLEAVRHMGLTPPFSCQAGVCGACRARCDEGSVHMRARMALEDAEIEKGAILTCQSVATSVTLKIVYG